ncbi:ADP-ribosyltransferase domain-containing protein [Aureivirga marina]|uniref:ADP-ribosyltransferase domain-containing protein n=1 Tax=Aureivirga marina TaxID=1182451 RepID=UPI0018CBEA4B|nr:ADP-ribosyltransferase domain-containing protein [Aureivirga marina]
MLKSKNQQKNKARKKHLNTVVQKKESNATFQFKDNRKESKQQDNLKKVANNSENKSLIQKKNNTGLPDNLKSGIENLSGYAMDDVKVHRNSAKPAQLKAHAYAQGSNIYLGPGQEKHLPHEAWHVVQQKQGRVQPTKQLKSQIPLNDDTGLEKEADVMGTKALQFSKSSTNLIQKKNKPINPNVVQRNLDTHVINGTSSGMLGNLLGTSTFEEIKTALHSYQNTTNVALQLTLLKKMKADGMTWLTDNSKKVDANSVTKRTSIRELLALVKNELATRSDDSMLMKESVKFEKNLGLYAFNNNRATTAATGAINKMKDVMGVTANNALAGDVFGGNSAKYAGVVGKEVNTVMAAINHGNLREKMTAFYNAALGPFKNMLDNHIKQKGSFNLWELSKNNLALKGINPAGIAAIEERKNQIDSYDEKFFNSDLIYKGAKATGQSHKYKDVYMAPMDPFYRADDDALKEGQRGVIKKLSPEGRTIANESALTSDHDYNFNWQSFNFTLAQLQGTAVGKVNSIFTKVQNELRDFINAGDGNEKLIKYNNLYPLVEKWLEQNKSKTDDNSNTKRTSLEALKTELRKIYSGSNRRDADLTNGRFSAHLSNREKAFIASQREDLSVEDMSLNARFQRLIGNQTPRLYDNTKKLPWEEGGTRFTPNMDNAWISHAIKKLKMPVVAGPSGTTDRMLRALKFLGNPVSPLDFRLALLGWMLTSNDHSFHEIMAVSKSFGLPYEPGSYAYHDIQPLTIALLRHNVCENGMFPDEIVYYSHKDDFILVQDAIDQVDSFDTKQIHANLPTVTYMQHITKNRTSPAAAMALGLYTTGSYLVQNPTRESSYPVANVKIRHHLKNKPELEKLNEKHERGNFSISELMKEGKTHNAALINALRDLPDSAHTVYRGQDSGAFQVGNVITYSKFTSTSLNKADADEFMTENDNNPPNLLKVAATKGKDIQPFSKYPEGEILFLPGTKFRVTNILANQAANGDISKIHNVIECVEV